jgi:hypothetical protein
MHLIPLSSFWGPPQFDQGTMKAAAKDKSAPAVTFKKNVPSPQDWALVLKRVAR